MLELSVDRLSFVRCPAYPIIGNAKANLPPYLFVICMCDCMIGLFSKDVHFECILLSKWTRSNLVGGRNALGASST